MTLALTLLQQAVAAAEPQTPLTWHSFCAQLPKTSSGTAGGVKYLVEVNSVIDVLFIQAADPAPRERELLSFRIMNNNLTLQSHGNYLFGVNVYEVMRKHKTKSDLLKYLFQLIQDYAGGTTKTEAATEPESKATPGLTALVSRLSPDQALTLVNTKRLPGGWFVGVGSCVTHGDNKPGLLIRVTDEDHRVFWSFIVRALPTKYMLQLLGVGRRDHLRPDATKDAAWRVVRNGDLGALDMPAEALLNRAVTVAVDFVRRNEDRAEYVAAVKAAAEPGAENRAADVLLRLFRGLPQSGYGRAPTYKEVRGLGLPVSVGARTDGRGVGVYIDVNDATFQLLDDRGDGTVVLTDSSHYAYARYGTASSVTDLLRRAVARAVRVHAKNTAAQQYHTKFNDAGERVRTKRVEAAEPESRDAGALSASALVRRYSKFLAEAVAEYQRQHLSDRHYHVRDEAGAKVFGIGIHYKSTPTVSKAFVFAPFDYDTKADHVGVGYYAVQDLDAAHNITVLHVQDGEVRGRFQVPVPVLDHRILRQFMDNPDDGKRAVVGLRVNAVLSAILRDIARARAAAGHPDTAAGPVHIYDIDDFHYRGSTGRRA